MKGIWKITLILVAFFVVTFAVAMATGALDEQMVQAKVRDLAASPHAFWVMGAVVIALLASDLLLPVPSIPVILIAGNTMGWLSGGIAAVIGMMLGSLIGYVACRYGGRRLFDRFVKPDEAARARRWFDDYGQLAIIISRPVPMLPELMACLGGMARMNVWRFTAAFLIATAPFAFACSIAGAATTIDNPWPGIGVGIVLPAVGWVVWRVATRRGKGATTEARVPSQ